jgi:hypothetical protein
MVKKLAFLFLIYHEIHFEEVWNIFFKYADPAKYTIRIHYKTDRSLRYFEKYKLKNCIATNYVIDTTIAQAHNLLIEDAMKDEDVYKTINLSQACIPLKSFEYVYNFLTNNNNSHFNKMPMSDWSLAVTGPALVYVKRDEICKAANWFILNREHAEVVLQHVEYFEYFKNVHSPEEFMYLTMLTKYCPANMVCTNYSAEGATTFTNWNSNWGMVYKYPVDASIKNYSEISEEEFTYLMGSPCLFGRKFNAGCRVNGSSISVYEPYVQLLSAMSDIKLP